MFFNDSLLRGVSKLIKRRNFYNSYFDDADILIEITKFLKEKNYFHIAASSASQALTLASGYDFQLAILDLKLADMDGDELYSKLIDKESHYTLPVVALIDSLDSEENWKK